MYHIHYLTCSNLHLVAEPVFVQDIDRPLNLNVTEGHIATFKCHADAEPRATVQWYINGDALDRMFLFYRYISF